MTVKSHKRPFLAMEMFYILTVMVVTCYPFVKIHQPIHLKIVTVYFMNPDFNKELLNRLNSPFILIPSPLNWQES